MKIKDAVELFLGPPHLEIDRGMVGSMVTFSIYLETETTPNTWIPFDLTGYSVAGTAKPTIGSETGEIVLGITAGAGGKIDVKLTPAQTTAAGAVILEGDVRMWPTGDTASLVTLVTFELPLEIGAST